MKMRLKDVNLIIAPTKKVEQTLKQYGMTKDIRIVPTGIQLEKFNSAVDENAVAQLREHEFRKEDKVLLSLGRLDLKNGLTNFYME